MDRPHSVDELTYSFIFLIKRILSENLYEKLFSKNKIVKLFSNSILSFRFSLIAQQCS